MTRNLERQEEQDFKDRRDRLSSGFGRGHSALLLPKSLIAVMGEEADARNCAADKDERMGQGRLSGNKTSDYAVDFNADSVQMPVSRKWARAQRRVFQTEDVVAFKAKVETMAKGSERRKTMEGMLKSLERDQVGMRDVVRLPKHLDSMLSTLAIEMPNFGEVLAAIRPILMLQKAGDKVIRMPPILLGGEPGVGKTYFAMRLATLLGLKSDFIGMETASASFILSGANLTWGNGAPGRIFDLVVHGEQANPLIVLDELDKACGSHRYSPVNSLYALLEPGTAREFRDESCPEVPLDVSRFNWIVTANDVDMIPTPLRNRLREFRVPMPTLEQKLAIVGCVYRDMRQENGWGRWFSPALPEASARKLAEMDGSVRTLRNILLEAFAHALERKSKVVLPEDIQSRSSGMNQGELGYSTRSIGFTARVSRRTQ